MWICDEKYANINANQSYCNVWRRMTWQRIWLHESRRISQELFARLSWSVGRIDFGRMNTLGSINSLGKRECLGSVLDASLREIARMIFFASTFGRFWWRETHVLILMWVRIWPLQNHLSLLLLVTCKIFSLQTTSAPGMIDVYWCKAHFGPARIKE